MVEAWPTSSRRPDPRAARAIAPTMSPRSGRCSSSLPRGIGPQRSAGRARRQLLAGEAGERRADARGCTRGATRRIGAAVLGGPRLGAWPSRPLRTEDHRRSGGQAAGRVWRLIPNIRHSFAMFKKPPSASCRRRSHSSTNFVRSFMASVAFQGMPAMVAAPSAVTVRDVHGQKRESVRDLSGPDCQGCIRAAPPPDPVKSLDHRRRARYITARIK